MTNTIPTNPTPTAVPWTPDMTQPNAQGQSTPRQAMPPQMPAAPYQPTPHYQSPQPDYAQASAPQGYPPQPQVHTPPAYPPQHQHMSPTQYAPAFQPVHHTQQPAAPQMGQVAAVPPHMEQAAQYAPQQHPHYAPGGPPPMPAALDAVRGAPQKSKSFLANLLKRSPKPTEAEFEPPVKSGSLLNKNFIIGAATGLVIGAFVLPMLVNILGGGSSSQTQVQAATAPVTAISPTSDGDTFLDNAMANDARGTP